MSLDTQETISAEIELLRRGAGRSQPRLDFPAYRSTFLRHPTKALLPADPEGAELVAPVFGHSAVDPLESDLTIQAGGVPIGERILIRGRLVDGNGRPVRPQLVEIWQANAAGRYRHQRDQHAAPTDPNFIGVGRTLTSEDGSYRSITIPRGAILLTGPHATWIEQEGDHD